MSGTLDVNCNECGEKFTLCFDRIAKGRLVFSDRPECPVCYGEDWSVWAEVQA